MHMHMISNVEFSLLLHKGKVEDTVFQTNPGRSGAHMHADATFILSSAFPKLHCNIEATPDFVPLTSKWASCPKDWKASLKLYTRNNIAYGPNKRPFV